MEGREKQRIESYQRVQTFLQVRPAPAPATYGEPKQVLDQVIAQLTDHSSGQVVGTRLSQAEMRRQETLVKQLRERHLRPIVAIARASVGDQPGIEKALRMPATALGVVKLLAEANAIKEAAALYQPTFVKFGRPADFIAQLSAAINAVQLSTIGHAKIIGRKVGSKAGIGQQLRRGRQAVEMLDTIVRIAFEGNDVVLAEWRVARRVRALPGGGPTEPLTPEPVVVQPVSSNTPAAA